MSIEVRPATGEDVPVLVGLERAIFGVDAWSEESVREEVTGARRDAVVAAGPEVVGYAISFRSDDVLDLQRVAVVPQRRRAGVARQLLDVLRARGRAAGATRMLLEVSAGNAGALAFYAREGFVKIDRRPRYYRDGSDALVLQLSLGRTS